MIKIVLVTTLLAIVCLAFWGWIDLSFDSEIMALVLAALIAYLIRLSRRVDRLSEQVTRLSSILEQPIESNVKALPLPVREDTASSLASTVTIAREPVDQPIKHHPSTDQSNTPTPDTSFASTLWQRAYSVLTQGNPFVRIGVLVMLIGLSFLVKYAANQQLLPIEVRLAGVILVGIVMIVIGWKTRLRPGGFGLVFQGGGIAAIYLTLFAAAKVFPVLTPALAFGLMLMIVALGTLLAVLQNAQALAVMATVGGFLTPILLGGDNQSPVGLFGFYLVLNLGVIAVAWFKSWRLLNWIAFTFTFAVFAFWAVFRYDPLYYLATQGFVVAFFALFLFIAILFSIKQPPHLKGMVDGSLVFGLPLVVLALQARWFYESEYGVALSAVTMAGVYLAIAYGLMKRGAEAHRLLVESFLAIAVGLATLSIPLALNAQWTSASWAVEAIGLLWIGLRQHKELARYAAYLLWLASLGALAIMGITAGETSLITGTWLSMALIALSAGILSGLLRRSAQFGKRELMLGDLFAHLGWALWCLGAYIEIQAHASLWTWGLWWLVLGVSYVALRSVERRTMATPVELGWWLLGFAVVGWMGLWDVAPSSKGGILGLLVWMAAMYRYLADRDLRSSEASRSTTWLHVLSIWFITSVVLLEANAWQAALSLGDTYSLVVMALAVILPLFILFYGSQKCDWPFKRHPHAYLTRGPLVGMAALFIVFIIACGVEATTPYLPLINPIDIAQAFMVATFIYAWRLKAGVFGWLPSTLSTPLIALIGFIWINVVMLRAIHQYAGIDYTVNALWASALVQMALSVLWISVALVAMYLSRRMASRGLWVGGAVLLGLILVKLFTKDIADRGTLFQVISFMVVGGGIALIGYLAPIPAKLAHNNGEVTLSDEQSSV